MKFAISPSQSDHSTRALPMSFPPSAPMSVGTSWPKVCYIPVPPQDRNDNDNEFMVVGGGELEAW
eukprot:768369-Hanusia_phi.AAC.6